MTSGPARAVTLLTLLASLALAGCSRPEPYSETMIAFGTLVDVTLYAESPAQADEALRMIESDLQYMHETWHPWKPGSLGRMNLLLPTGGWFSAGPSLLPIIEQSTTLSEQSEGLFNPAIGQLVALWGFHGEDLPAGPPPPPDEIASLVGQAPQMADLEIDGIRIRSTNAAVKLDFGAFAKGYGVDRVIERLVEMGITDAIVNAGGDLRAIGRHGDRDWRVGIRDPRGQGVLASLEVSGDESVFTSGNYERYFEWDGKRYHHIIDPRTGYPADDVLSVTVLHESGAVADAAATALFVAGREDWPRIAAGMGVEAVMVIDADGGIALTPAMAERIRFESESTPEPQIRPLP